MLLNHSNSNVRIWQWAKRWKFRDTKEFIRFLTCRELPSVLSVYLMAQDTKLSMEEILNYYIEQRRERDRWLNQEK
jgi:hypothetical protein